ncbi:MAG: cobalt ECF transporter T component CbiQ [Pseudomonadota bacterium]
MTGLDRLAQASRWRTRSLAEKALLSLGLLVLAVGLPPWPGGAVVLAVAMAATLRAGVPAGEWARAAAPALGFLALGALALAVSLDGRVTVEPARDLLLRGSAAVAALLLLATTTPAADLVRGLRRLGLPPELAEMALATYRFIFLLADSARSIHAAQAARLGTVGWRRSLTSLGLLVAMLLPRALDRARRLEMGLAARGFDGSLPTLAPGRPASAAGMATVAAVLAVVLGVGLWT